MNNELLWWQKGIIYQIYPRSFYDSNGDGIGDLQGILQKIDYLKWLGVNILWLNPINLSPMKDFGYDIKDYYSIDPIFGIMKDFDILLESVHRNKMKLILDFVPNHTSSEHEWFIDSSSSKNADKKDWYIWRDPLKDGRAPNNWLSNFGGPAWSYCERRDQFYYHAFLPSQPDLNWRNTEVQEEMFKSMRFWLDRGVDGFRVDVIWHIIKDEEFRDNPEFPGYEPHLSPNRKLLEVYNSDRPEVHSIIEKMRHVLDSYHERMMVGEIYLPLERLMAYYGSEGKGVHLPFNFQLFHVPWTPKEIASVVENYESSLPEHGWPNWVLGNHDNRRLASRIGDAQVRIAAMLLLTLRGTPTIYYGEELGMHDVYIPPHKVQDPFEKNVPGMGHGRDPQRTPMLWSDSSEGGFSTAIPWLPVSDDYKIKNVSIQMKQDDSLLMFYQRLIKLRMDNEILLGGNYKKVEANESIFSYLRTLNEKKILIILNFLPEGYLYSSNILSGKIIFSTHSVNLLTIQKEIYLRPNEGVVVYLDEI